MLLDVAIGIVLTELVGWYWNFVPTGWMYLLGATFALAPDLDFLVLYFRKGEIAMYRGHTIDHRDLFHKPLLFIPIGALFVWFIFDSGWMCALFVLASFAHFFHDSVGIGWGVRWLSPFGMKNYKFFCNSDGSPSTRFLTSWSPSERDTVVREKGDPNWAWNYYLRPFIERITVFAFVEVVIPVLFIVWFLARIMTI